MRMYIICNPYMYIVHCLLQIRLAGLSTSQALAPSLHHHFPKMPQEEAEGSCKAGLDGEGKCTKTVTGRVGHELLQRVRGLFGAPRRRDDSWLRAASG